MSITCALWPNRCRWAVVLVVRGRFCCVLNSYVRSNRALEILLWHWDRMRRPYVVYKVGNEAIGGGDPIPGWFVGPRSIHRVFCQCNLVGIDSLGAVRIINGQGWHHPGKFCGNIGRPGVPWPSACNCQFSKINSHHPSRECNKHTMDAHIATNLIRLVVQVLVGAPPVVAPKFGRWESPRTAHLPKDETMSKIRPRSEMEFADDGVRYFLARCEERRGKSKERPPKRVSWENRPRWNGSIINLALVVGGVGHAQGAAVVAPA